jgi:hypothetical protein
LLFAAKELLFCRPNTSPHTWRFEGHAAKPTRGTTTYHGKPKGLASHTTICPATSTPTRIASSDGAWTAFVSRSLAKASIQLRVWRYSTERYSTERYSTERYSNGRIRRRRSFRQLAPAFGRWGFFTDAPSPAAWRCWRRCGASKQVRHRLHDVLGSSGYQCRKTQATIGLNFILRPAAPLLFGWRVLGGDYRHARSDGSAGPSMRPRLAGPPVSAPCEIPLL